MSYALFHSEKYYELKEPLQKILKAYEIDLSVSGFNLIYDNLITTDNDIKILGTLVNFELKLKDVLVIYTPNEVIKKINEEFSNCFIGFVSDDYDKLKAKRYYQLKLKYRSIRLLKGAIKLNLLKVVPDWYKNHYWEDETVESINKIANDSLIPIHDYFEKIKLEIKKELTILSKIKLVNKTTT